MPRIYTLFNRSIWNILEKAVSLQRQEEDLGYPGRTPRGAAAKNQHCFGSKTSPPLLHFKNSRHAYHQNRESEGRGIDYFGKSMICLLLAAPEWLFA